MIGWECGLDMMFYSGYSCKARGSFQDIESKRGVGEDLVKVE